MSSGFRRPRLRSLASCSACVLLLMYTAGGVGADTAKDVYIEDTDRFPGWKGELPRSAEEDGPNTIGYGEGGVVSPHLPQRATTLPLTATADSLTCSCASGLSARQGSAQTLSQHQPLHRTQDALLCTRGPQSCLIRTPLVKRTLRAATHQIVQLLLMRVVYVLRQEEWRGEVEQVSWSPRAFLYKKFLSEEECDHLINHVRYQTFHVAQ